MEGFPGKNPNIRSWQSFFVLKKQQAVIIPCQHQHFISASQV
jgi:hypothetical protein